MKKLLVSMMVIASAVFANAQTTTLTPGQKAPDFKLKNTDGKEVSLSDFPNAKGFIVVFTCNDCPYAKAYEQRIMDLNTKFAPQGYPVIAINPNDPAAVPGESFDKMKALAVSKKYSFPYLFDAGQTVTDAYGAKATPHTFVITKTPEGNIIKYTGAIDNDTENTDAGKTKYVEEVIASLVKNQTPAFTVTKAIGCTVKRKKA